MTEVKRLPVKESVVKRLLLASGNRCAMDGCSPALLGARWCLDRGDRTH